MLPQSNCRVAEIEPSERVKFFEEEVDLNGVVDADLVKSKTRAPLTAISALGLANASGFKFVCLYHCIGFPDACNGNNAPFATYRNNLDDWLHNWPAGFLAAGIFLAWRVPESNWKRWRGNYLFDDTRHEFSGTPMHEA